MSDITINYKGSPIATMDASGTKTLLTEGKYCEDDLEVVYVKPGGGGGVLTLLNNGTYNLSSGTQTMTIPVTYSGTAKFVVVAYVSTLADVTHGILSFRWFSFPTSDVTTVLGSAYAFGVISMNASNTYTYYGGSTGYSLSLSSSNISCPRPGGSGYQWKAGEYHWYIYG